MSILVMGASGNTGAAIVRQLQKLDAPFSVMASSIERAADLGLQTQQIRIGNYSDINSLVSVFHKISRIYLLMPIHPGTVEWVKNVVIAAKKAGVKHIVKQSGLGASLSSSSRVIRDHAATDEEIKSSGLDYTILQPNSFLQNFYGNLPTINAEGRFYSSIDETAVSMVDIHDVAAVAAATLTQKGHIGKTYVLTGPEALTSSEQAKILSEASGKPITYVNVPEAAIVESLKNSGMDAWFSENIAELLSSFMEGGHEKISADVETVLGRPPRSFSDFGEELSRSIQ